MSWVSELPEELLCRPRGLVVLTGLDITYNAIHKLIWDCFCNNRKPDRVPLNFKVHAADHEYPKKKAKRQSYEWYIPKGILKTGWMKKHVEEIPALVIVFFDLDWDQPMWRERQMECATKVEIIRHSLAGRNTKVAVVLIQKNAPLPPGEDITASQRAALLCSACQLSAKSLFVLSHVDNLLGYAVRLENAFYEFVQNYYHAEARRVKAHRDLLNKTTHQLLFVRHQFKAGFYNELKQDTHTSIKHYKQAYVNLAELRMYDTNLLEVKTIAGFINYKICRLSFLHKTPLDAINQFRKHTDFFKVKVGIADLAFEHSAWMAKQFQIFGDLFDEAIKVGLTALQTQHPGFYYQQAATHAANRKNFAKLLCKPCNVTFAVLDQMDHLDFYGQRPWRQGHQSIDPPDPTKEKEGKLCLQQLELKEDHSGHIIPLLSGAVAQFKKYQSPRMKRSLMVLMGQEYFNAGKHSTSLILLNRVLPDYRAERWWTLLTSLLTTSLRCAYLMASLPEYIAISLEFIGKCTKCEHGEKVRIQQNLIKVMKGELPSPEPDVSEADAAAALAKWESRQPGEDKLTVDLTNIVPFVDCRAGFAASECRAEQSVVVFVLLRLSSPLPFRFLKLSVELNNPTYNHQCVVLDLPVPMDQEPELAGGTTNLYLVPGRDKRFSFSFLPHQDDVGHELEIVSVSLLLGSEESRCAVLHWIGSESPSAMSSLQSGRSHFHASLTQPDSDANSFETQITILPHQSQLSLTAVHASPALVGERYRLGMIVTNGEREEARKIRMNVAIEDGDLSNYCQLGWEERQEELTLRLPELALTDLPAGSQTEKVLLLCCRQPGSLTLNVEICYEVEVSCSSGSINCRCVQTENVQLDLVNPFDFNFQILSMQMAPRSSVHAQEAFLVMMDLMFNSDWSVKIIDSELKLNPNFQADHDDLTSQIKDKCFSAGESAREVHSLSAATALAEPAVIGMCSISWARQHPDGTLSSVASSKMSLPYVQVEHLPLCVELEMPACGLVRSRLMLFYHIHNRTAYSQEVKATMDSAEAFMFSGKKQCHVRILPHSSYTLPYCLYPLLPGDVVLPVFSIDLLRYPGMMHKLICDMLPKRVYIMPCGKKGGHYIEEALIEQ